MSQAGSLTPSGSGGSGVTSITGDTGATVSGAIDLYAQTGSANSGSSVLFNGSSATEMDLVVTDGNLNTIIGAGAGVIPNTATSCTGLGYQALASITDDDTHVAIGRGALQSANDGSANTAIGAYALNAMVAGGDNTAVGAHAGISLPNGDFNTMIGYFSGTNYTNAESSNILIGNAGVATENNTIRIGTQGAGALEQDTCFVAGVAGVSVSNLNVVTIDTTTGQLGSQAPSSGGITTIDGDSGSVTGSTIDLYAQTGSANCGSSVLFSAASGTELDLVVTDGNGNTIIGGSAGTPSSGGSTDCTALGRSALGSISSDFYHTAIGVNALSLCSGSRANTAVGTGALGNFTSGNVNTAIGGGAGVALTSGAANTLVGDGAAYNSGGNTGLLTGSHNTMLGTGGFSAYTSSESSNIVIGSGVIGTVGESNALHIGDTGAQAVTSAYIGGIAGVAVSNTNMVTIDTTTGQLGSQAIPGVPSTLLFVYMLNNTVGITGDGTEAALVFDTVLTDTASGYNAGTGEYTIPATGYYYGSAQVTSLGTNSNNGAGFMLLNKNGSNLAFGSLFNPYVCAASYPTANLTYSFTGMIKANAGDVIQVLLDVQGNGSQNVYAQGGGVTGRNFVTFFNLFRIA